MSTSHGIPFKKGANQSQPVITTFTPSMKQQPYINVDVASLSA